MSSHILPSNPVMDLDPHNISTADQTAHQLTAAEPKKLSVLHKNPKVKSCLKSTTNSESDPTVVHPSEPLANKDPIGMRETPGNVPALRKLPRPYHVTMWRYYSTSNYT